MSTTDFITVATIAVPAVVSVIGFLITVHSLKKNFQNELKKQKTDIQLEKMASIPYDLLCLLKDMTNTVKSDNSNSKKEQSEEPYIAELTRISSTIYAYGSKQAIHIFASMMSDIYASEKSSGNPIRRMSYFILLITKIRYDITGEFVSVEDWFKINITDYPLNKNVIRENTNALIDELNLGSEYRISS